MSIFNEMQDKGQLSQILQRRLNITGAAPSPAVAPELFPTLTYENDRPEWGYLKGEHRFGRLTSVAAAAGLYSAMTLSIQSGDVGLLTVIKRVVNLSTIPVYLSFDTSAPGGGSSGYGLRKDTRGPSNSRTFWGTGSYAAISPNSTGIPANSALDLDFVLANPAQWFAVKGSAVNTGLVIAIEWTERPAMPGELG